MVDADGFGSFFPIGLPINLSSSDNFNCDHICLLSPNDRIDDLLVFNSYDNSVLDQQLTS